MPATTDNKGIASGYTPGEDGWGNAQNQNLRAISAMLIEGFANEVTTTTGLTYGYKPGVGLTGTGLVQIAAGTVILPPSVSGYLVRTVAGVVTFQTSALFPDKIHLATITTNISSITSIIDNRYVQDSSQDGTNTARNFAAIAAVSGQTLNLTGNAIVGGSALVTGAITGASVAVANAAFPVDTRSGVASFGGGPAQGADGTVSMAAIVNPSATALNRYVGWQSGDNTTIRGMQLRMARLYIGTNSAPAFTGGEQVAIEGQVNIQNGAEGLRLGPGGSDHTYLAFYPRTATPNVRGGYIGYAAGASPDLSMINSLGALYLAASSGSLTIGAGGATLTGPLNATAFNGSGAGLTANTVPQASVAGLITALAAANSAANAAQTTANSGVSSAATAQSTANTAVSNAATAQSAANAANATNSTQDGRLTAVEAARAFAVVVSDNVPVARVNFDWASLGYTGTNTGSRSFNTVLTVLPAAGVAYNQIAQQDIVEEINQLRDCLRQLAFDLISRNLV